MVNNVISLDTIFGSLADETRRDILQRLLQGQLNVSEIAEPYDMSLAAVSKHLKVLEKARLIRRRRQGRHYYMQAAPQNLQMAETYLRELEQLWAERFDRLEQVIQ